MNKLLVRSMFFIVAISFGGALLSSTLPLFVASLTFSLGLFILLAGFIKPIHLVGLLNIKLIFSALLCFSCFLVLPMVEAFLLNSWVLLSALISVEKLELKYEQ